MLIFTISSCTNPLSNSQRTALKNHLQVSHVKLDTGPGEEGGSALSRCVLK